MSYLPNPTRSLLLFSFFLRSPPLLQSHYLSIQSTSCFSAKFFKSANLLKRNYSRELEGRRAKAPFGNDRSKNLPTLIFFPRPRNVDDKPHEHARLLLVPCYVSSDPIASFIYFKSVLRITNLRAPLCVFDLFFSSRRATRRLPPLLPPLFPQLSKFRTRSATVAIESVANASDVVSAVSPDNRFAVNSRLRSLSVRRHSLRTTIEKAARKCFSKLFDIRRMFIGPEDVV